MTSTARPLGPFELAADAAATPAALAAGTTWRPARVPGGVHESLLDAGLIGHPYFGDNERSVRWVEDATWWYRTVFDGPGELEWDERLRLVCSGLDTVASVWLNGVLVGTHASQFRPGVFDVTSHVRERNVLLVRFAPPLAGLTAPAGVADAIARTRKLLAPGDAPPPGVLSTDPAFTLRRKAAFSWGWDFAPRVPSVGITGPVELRRERAAVLAGHHVRAVAADAAARTAEVAIDVEADAFAVAGELRADVVLTAPDGREHAAGIPLGPSGRGGTVISLADAHLWWTHDLGDQPLYAVSIALTAPDGTVLDRSEDRVGLRTIALDRSPDDAGGRLFRFVLNGVPIFARGANWVPASMLTGSVEPATVRSLVATARRGEMTMLRVWGGGIYEQDAFYRACDDPGVLVWQDFMFACVDYPSDDPELRAEVAREADHQVRRLRNRACLALWAGNNEVHAIHGFVHGNLEPGDWGWSFFHDLLPAAVERRSPEVPYWPGSPWADSDPAGTNGVADGDRHAWEVWHGVDVGAGGPAAFPGRGAAVHFARYRHDRGKFISEFGLHAAPDLGTLRRWTPPGSLAPHSPEFDHRNKDVPKNKGDDLMFAETGLPADLEQYADFSMACQAEGLKFGIEHYRRRQPHCSGTLLWQFNDPWPGLSWSVVDHDLIPKAGFHFAQRAYRTVLTSFVRADDGRLELWVTNSGRRDVPLDLRVEVATFAGEHVIDERVAAVARAGASRPVWSAAPQTYAPGPDRYAWVSDADGATEPNRLFFAPVKDLPLAAGRVELTSGPNVDGRADLTLTSTGYSYLARIVPPAPGAVFGRNYLDLRDGERVGVRAEGLPDGFDPAALRVATFGTTGRGTA
ncbi:glycoside hydrolase family 2 protein [Actinomadura rayongensis]|uniref:beta-mannosidase n=1 Tax=Actinomadura rayongensis TaxID=1429076 RepID=A0A6I4WNV3_9ACTN|nr:glycoside hydrolase family 2 protein [Actinomadura rayongensis]MXQ68272.1 glycoside hydrolase family 2 protein [Actinomadura rayongensis]